MTSPLAAVLNGRQYRVAGALLLALLGIAGCTRGTKSTPGGQTGTANGPAEPGGNARSTGGDAPGQSVGFVHDSRTKWINDVPYDVWFDHPLDVYTDSTPLTAAANTGNSGIKPEATVVEPVPPETGSAAATTPAAGGHEDAAAVNWDELVSADILIAEIKDLRVHLTANLQTVATFNRAGEPIANDAMILSTLAGVAERTTQDINWRDKAKFVRDLAGRISTVEGTGREPFQKAKDPFDAIVTMLDGGPPPEMESAERLPFADYADRGEMMARIKSSLDWLKSEVNTESRLKEYKDQVVRTGTVLSVLGTVCGDEGYEHVEEPQFRAFIQEFISANADIVKAATDQNFGEFEAARGRLQNSCGACHSKYKDAG